MDKKRPSFFVFVLCLFFVFSPIRATSQQDSSDLQARIQRIESGLIPYPGIVIKGQAPTRATLASRIKIYGLPGLSIAVINNLEIEWTKGYGVKESGRPDPVDPDTLFQAASISKPLAAASALYYVERGLLNLDENVNDWLHSWKVPENSWTRKSRVTLRGLLSHTAGVTVNGFEGYVQGKDIPTLQQILDGLEPANSAAIRVDSEIGAKFRYSGGGYTILQQLLIDVLNKPFPQIMRQTVLDKLSLKNSTYEQSLPESLAAKAASGHQADGSVIPGKWHIYPEMAAAGLWTTPSDLAGFAIEVMRSRHGKSEVILSQAMTELMLTPQKEDVGLGLRVKGTDLDFQFFHAGGNEGFRCFMVGFPERGQGAVMMTNSDLGLDLIAEVLSSFAAEYGWPAYMPVEKTVAVVEDKALQVLAGTYQFTPSDKMTVSFDDGRLFAEPVYVHPNAKGKCEFFPESEMMFFSTQTDATLVFSKDIKGRVTGLRLKRKEIERNAVKVLAKKS
jgi:CubicO group peptidase (beta-lactamase class C family)